MVKLGTTLAGGKNRSLLIYFLLVFSFTLSACGGGGAGSPAPTAPSTAPTVTATGSISAVSLSWTTVTGATSYNIYQGTSPGVSTSTPSTSTSASKSITGLTNGTTYYFIVKAVNSVGEGPASAEVSATPSGVTAVAAGNGYSSALKSDGTVWTWGYGGGKNVSVPTEVSGISSVTAISSGAEVSAALKSDGTVWVWGYPYSSSPSQITGSSSITSLSAGQQHFLFLDSSGNVWAQGRNDYGQLGNGVTTWGQAVTISSVATQVPNLSSISAITAGRSFSVALKSDGTVWEWGHVFDPVNSTGCSGIIGVNNFACANPIQVSGLTGVTAISASSTGAHVLALKSDGTVLAWSAADRDSSGNTIGNWSGELGDGTTTPSRTPVQVTGLTGIVKIFAGNGVSFAQTSDGTTYAWGDNSSGQYGNGTTTNSLTPIVISALSGMTISGGTDHVLAVKADGTAWAWGDNLSGQLGDGSTTNSLVPMQPTF